MKLPSRKQKPKKYLDPGTIVLIKQVFWGLLVFTVVALIITAIWYFTRLPSFTLSTITVEGGVTINKGGVETRAAEKLEGTYLKLVPKRFAYLYPEDEIVASVSEVERIKDVAVERVSGRELLVTFDEYLPDTLWCKLTADSECLFLDETGFAFGPAPVLSGGSVVRYFATERDVELRVHPFTELDYQTSKDFTELLGSIGWFVTKIEINSAHDAFYTLAQGGEIKTTLTEPAIRPFNNLETILKSKEFSHLKPGNFQYLDLRFGTRVFVNEELAAPEEEEAEEVGPDLLDTLILDVLE
jgi:hypothetical protein